MMNRSVSPVSLALGALLAAALALPVAAKVPVTAKEASMVVTGRITVTPDGKVAKYTLDRADKLPRGAHGVLDKVIPAWRFQQPTKDGKAVTMRSTMAIRLLARETKSGSLEVGLGGVSFSDPNAPKITRIKRGKTIPYPGAALSNRVAGTVYTLLQLDATGDVTRAAVEQVNLRAYLTKADTKRWRERLGEYVIEQVKRFKFKVPAAALDVNGNTYVRLPVRFQLHDLWSDSPKSGAAYASWTVYLPGPRHKPAWMDPTLLGDAADTLAPGQVQYLGHGGLKLLSPHA